MACKQCTCTHNNQPCDDQRNGYTCRRPRGHDGPHIACTPDKHRAANWYNHKPVDFPVTIQMDIIAALIEDARIQNGWINTQRWRKLGISEVQQDTILKAHRRRYDNQPQEEQGD